MRSWVKVLHDVPIQIGSVVKFREQIPQRTGFGEVAAIMSRGSKIYYELILLNKRMDLAQTLDFKYKKRTMLSDKCKHVKISKLKTSKDIELGDVVQHKFLTFKKYGIVVGFVHPDGLISTSYENGLNDVDLIQCVEIHKSGLIRKRDVDGNFIRFTCNRKRLKTCQVDMWCDKGATIVD